MSSPRIFASDSSVPVEQTRREISGLLTEWDCASIGWTDHLADSKVSVEFTWKRDDALYRVRFTLGIPKDREVQPRHPRASYDQVRRKYFAKLNDEEKAQAWRSAHRLLLIKLKADLNCAHARLAKAEEIFMPYMVDQNGNTLAEVMLPRLREAYALLPPGPKDPPAGGST